MGEDPSTIREDIEQTRERMTETVAQRACKKQKEQALRIKPSVDQSKTRLTHCL